MHVNSWQRIVLKCRKIIKLNEEDLKDITIKMKKRIHGFNLNLFINRQSDLEKS